MVGETLEAARLKKRAQAEFDARRLAQRFVPRAAFAQVGGDGVASLRIRRRARRLRYRLTALTHLHQIADAVAVDRNSRI